MFNKNFHIDNCCSVLAGPWLHKKMGTSTRRLSHVQSLLIRNIPCTDGQDLPSVYFRIGAYIMRWYEYFHGSLVVLKKVVYESEKCQSTLNPVFFMDLKEKDKENYQLVSDFDLIISWGTTTHKTTVQNEISVQVKLNELTPMDAALAALPILPSNSVIFQLIDGFYIQKHLASYLQQDGILKSDVQRPTVETNPLIEYDLSLALKSIQRLSVLGHQLEMLSKRRGRCRNQIMEKLQLQEQESDEKSRSSALKTHLDLLRQQVSRNRSVFKKGWGAQL